MEDVPKDYKSFLKGIKEKLKKELKGKDETPDDNEYLLCHNNDELLIKNANLNDSSLFFDFNTDIQNQNQPKDNNEDIKAQEEKNENFLKPSENIINILELNSENNSFRKREAKYIKPGGNTSIKSEIKKISYPIFKTQIIHKSDENKESMRKNKNSSELMDKFLYQGRKIPLPDVNCFIKNDSWKIYLKEIKVSKNASSETNISTSKQTVSINQSKILQSIILNKLSGISINYPVVRTSGLSIKYIDVNDQEILNRTNDDIL